jgi:transcriptional regulator with XRE-family HTH domain
MGKPERPDLSAQYDRLRKLIVIARKVRNLTQREIARRIGQPPSFIGKFENGTRGLDVVEFVAVAKAIGVDPRRIITKLLKRWPDVPPESQPPTVAPPA